ncbi:MAG TPA: DUF1931 family protein [Candidatus Elarobacter sp.]|jgi:hypothetical protein
MAVIDVAKFEHFFRVAASLDVDREDVRRYEEFVNEKIADFLIRAQAIARANVRDLIEPQDLPVTKGIAICEHEFDHIDREIGMRALLADLLVKPPNIDYTDETERRLPSIAGGLSVALARSFPILDPNVKNPQQTQWDRARRLFALLV